MEFISLTYIYIIPHSVGSVKRVSLIFFEIFLRALGEQPACSAHCEGFGSVSLPLTIIVYHILEKMQDGKMHKNAPSKSNSFVHIAESRPGVNFNSLLC